MIDPNPASVENLLNSSFQYVVPKNQRNFAWGRGEALEFWDDLKSYTESTEGNLFLGTTIFYRDHEDTKKIQIVDGQQRLTTIIILLVACRNLARKINLGRIAEKIQERITFEEPTTANFIGSRLISSDSIRDVFEEMMKYEWSGNFTNRINGKPVKRQVNRVKPVYDFFYNEIKDFDQNKLSKLLRAIYDTYVVKIEIQDIMEAFNIFERNNARGVELEASDLLKNYLFIQGVEECETRWEQIVDNSLNTILRMLKHFYVSRNGYVNKSELYRKIRLYSSSIGATKLVEELESFSDYYSMILSADTSGIRSYYETIGYEALYSDQDKIEKIENSIQGLRLFNVTQTIPLIFSATNCFIRTSKNPRTDVNKYVSFLELLEKYHFINNAICGRIGNEVEKLYADYCVKYTTSNDFEDTTRALISVLKGQLAQQDEFVSRFMDINYDSDNIPLIAYIFDRINNINLRPGQRIKIFNPDFKYLRKNHNIEHFLPQKPEDEKLKDSDAFEVVDNIGNLLVISFSTNSKLGNKRPDEKFILLKGELSREIQNMDYIKSFVEKYEKYANNWSKEVILQRSKDIALHAYGEIWKIR